MQKANCIVRLGGDLRNAVPRMGVTPAEILILRHIHGDDAVVDIRPTEFDKKVRQERELERLAQRYDGASTAFGGKPDEDRKSIIETLFPGAMKKLPLTLAEIGIDDGAAPAEPEVAPNIPDADEDELADRETADQEDGKADDSASENDASDDDAGADGDEQAANEGE